CVLPARSGRDAWFGMRDARPGAPGTSVPVSEWSTTRGLTPRLTDRIAGGRRFVNRGEGQPCVRPTQASGRRQRAHLTGSALSCVLHRCPQTQTDRTGAPCGLWRWSFVPSGAHGSKQRRMVAEVATAAFGTAGEAPAASVARPFLAEERGILGRRWGGLFRPPAQMVLAAGSGDLDLAGTDVVNRECPTGIR